MQCISKPANSPQRLYEQVGIAHTLLYPNLSMVKGYTHHHQVIVNGVVKPEFWNLIVDNDVIAEVSARFALILVCMCTSILNNS